MTIVELTLAIEAQQQAPAASLQKWALGREGARYVALVYNFHHDSMAGTYIDFPGHIEHTDDGCDAANCPLESLYRLEAAVIHLARRSGSGKISADELRASGRAVSGCQALIVNALGELRFDQIDHRSVYLGREAVEWIIDTGAKLLVADIYESDSDPQDVFPDLFAAGVATVCHAVNLHLLTRPRLRLTALPLRFPGVTQLPCRLLAEIED